jgi:sugar lactone lactonase YvrE
MVEFSQGNVVVLDKGGAKRVLAHVGSGVAGTILGDDGALYVAKSDLGAFMRNMPPPGDGGGPPPGDGGPPPGGGGGLTDDGTPAAIWRIDLATEEAAILYDKENGEPLAGPNDLAKDQWGDLWVSQPAGASVLNLRTDGSHIETALTGVSGVNGITLSPDKAELYVMSGDKLMGFEVAGRGKLATENGKPRGRVLLAWPAEFGTPDGMKTQANGNILCACKDAGIVVVTPAGELVSQTLVEGQQIVNVAFSPLEENVLYLAIHPSDNMTGGLAKIGWPDNGVF